MAGNTIGEAWVLIRPDMTGFTTSLQAGVATAQAAVKPLSVPVTADMAPLLADVAVLRAMPGAGGGGGGTGIIGTMLWGAGGIAGFAAFGSLLSLAGFGFEHVLTTAVGLAGSLAGALGGLGVLAVGVFGKMGVGMISDMLVMSSTIADTKTFYTALSAIALAQATYGKNSAQAALATQALNVQMQLLGNTAGVQAELGLAKAAQALNTFWDQATSSARVAAVGFLMPFFQVAYTYIPLIAAAATKNFTIMTATFRPLILWVDTTGTIFFKNLENLFAQAIPTGVNVLTQFVELLAKIANFAAPLTGGLLNSISTFLTNLNTPSGFVKLEGFMTTMIRMFHDWAALIKQVGITLYDLFKNSVGLGTTLVTTLTAMLVKLDAWLVSSAGSNAVHNLFAVHLQEIQAILAILPSLFGAFAQLYLTIAPPLTVIVTGLALMVGWMLKVPVVGTILAWGAAIALIASRMSLLGPAMTLIGSAAIPILLRGLALLAPGLAASAAAALGFDTALDANPISLIIIGIAALGVALVLLVTHFKQVTQFLSSGWGQALQIALAVTFPWIGLPLIIITHWQLILTFFKALPGLILDALKALPGLLLKWAMDALGAGVGMLKGLIGALPQILLFFVTLPIKISAILAGSVAFLLLWGWQIIMNLLGGIGRAAPAVWSWFKALPGTILGILAGAVTWLVNVGIFVIMGFLTGIRNAAPTVWNWFLSLPGVIIRFFAGAPGWLFNAGKAILQGLLNGLLSIWHNITGFIGGIGSWIASHKGPLDADAVLLYPHGQAIMKGLQSGLQAGIPPILKTLTGLSTSMKGALGGGSLSLAGATHLGSSSALAGGVVVNQVNNFHGHSKQDVAASIEQANRKLVLALRAR